MLIRRARIVLLVTVLCLPLCAMGQGGRISPDMRAMLSRFQSMGHGYHSAAEWREVFDKLDSITARAEAEGRTEEVIEAGLLRAMVYSDMLHEYVEALSILEDLKERYRSQPLPGITKLYVRQAGVYAKLGDENAIRELIREFRHSPHYDAQAYAYSGGQGRDVPLAMTRPGAAGNGSLTITAMQKYLTEARVAPGRPCPSFETADSRGKVLRMEDYRGRVVLLDFWLGRWGPWRSELSQLLQTYRHYHPHGFDIIGVSLDHDVAAARSMVQQRGIPWRQVYGDLKVPGLFGVYGEAGSVLVDGDGVIVGHNLKSSELILAIRNALGMEE